MPSSPRISGAALRGLARLAHQPGFALVLQKFLRAELKIDALAQIDDSLRGDLPLDATPRQGRPPRTADAKLPPPTTTSWAGTSEAFHFAYRSGRATPSEVVDRALAEARNLAQLRPSVGPILDFNDVSARADAAASTARWRSRMPRGPLDGVPFAVK